MAWVKKLLDQGYVPSILGEMPSYYNMIQWGNTIDNKIGLPDMWIKNAETNLDYFDAHPDKVKSGYLLEEVIGDTEHKSMIVVGASPILKDTWQPLLNAEKERFRITATNSSAKYLVDRGVIPDYVVLADGQKGKWTLDIGEENLSTALICSPFAEPETIAAWKGSIYVISFNTPEEALAKRIQEKYGAPVGQAGNSFNCAVSFFSEVTKIKIFIFVGNELSFKQSYYVEGKSINDGSMYFYSKDVDGERVRTLIPLFQYKLWMENFMWDCRGVGYFFFNCSKGILGVDSSGERMPCISNTTLDDAMEQVRGAFEFEKEDDIVKSKKIYDLMFASGHYEPQNGAKNWLTFEKMMSTGEAESFKKGLDVGCGLGYAVYEMVNRGYDVYGVDIADNTIAWKELGVLDRCKISPANDMPYEDDEFDFVVCSDLMEHIPESYIEASLKEIARVGSDRFWFAIANGMDNCGKYLVPSHLVIGNMDFWLPKIEKAGLKTIYASENYHHISIVAKKEKK